MIRLYWEGSLLQNQEVFLSETQSHYIQKVMRLQKGDEIFLFNGEHGEWKAQIEETFKKSTKLCLISQTRSPIDEGNLCLLFSPLKPKRQEFLIEKATELGVSCLYPVKFERTSIPRINLEKMQAHLREASEQSRRLTIPEIKPITSFKNLFKDWPPDKHLFFGDETLGSPFLSKIKVDSQKSYGFLVGPEGGFTSQELIYLKSQACVQGVTLNTHILRAETAALVGISYLQLQLQFLK
ncbi:MAG: 16S rRNA (uracil(1498)-N(3))-methyltransferase [Proteobacteria bacterium]|nr:16S rRNA (uracil(1498)-N(3))-methyltransferase [Pseudomonadota bacterium]